jgi:hypothetical protein
VLFLPQVLDQRNVDLPAASSLLSVNDEPTEEGPHTPGLAHLLSDVI